MPWGCCETPVNLRQLSDDQRLIATCLCSISDFANDVPFWCDTDQANHNNDHNYENGMYANKSYHDEGEYADVFDNDDDPDHDYDGDDEDDRNLY